MNLPTNNISYTISIFNIINNQNNIISNETNDINGLLSNYGIERIFIINNLFMPLSNSAVIDLTYSGNNHSGNKKAKLFNSALAEGNIVKIDEVFNGVYKAVFVGYIATVNISQGTQTGLNLTLNCLSLLGQLSYQLVANYINDTLMLGGGEFPITDFVANQVELGKILLAFQNESLMSYAINHQIINSYDSYNNQQLAFLIRAGEDGLSSKSVVNFFASTNDNRFDSLLRTIYAYQRLIYQDLDGTIKIAIPSVTESGLSDSISDFYNFDIGKFNDSVAEDSIKYERYSISKNAGIVCNRAFASLIPLGFNIIGSNEQNTINYVSQLSGNIFSRGQQLLKTGIFTLSRNDIVDLSDNIVRDPTLLRLFDITQGINNNIVATDVSGVKSNKPIVGLYANRLLAQDAFLETQLEIDLPRLSCYNKANGTLTDIPLGHTVNVDDNGNLGLEISKFYCYQMMLNYDINGGTRLSLGLCKPYSFTTLWDDKGAG
ncbi:MAG: hypothetical protein ACK52I_24025 [Pseudomonadota bacterium]